MFRIERIFCRQADEEAIGSIDFDHRPIGGQHLAVIPPASENAVGVIQHFPIWVSVEREIDLRGVHGD